MHSPVTVEHHKHIRLQKSDGMSSLTGVSKNLGAHLIKLWTSEDFVRMCRQPDINKSAALEGGNRMSPPRRLATD